MSKNKLAKFADMERYPNVFQAPPAAGGPNIQPAPFPLKGRWAYDFFHNDNPIVLELGCGRGEYTVGLAQRFPQQNFIGVDIKGARMWTGATQALQQGLCNVAFLRTSIEFIDRFFSPGEVGEIWLTFSDPQMRKATKRLSSTYFLQRYRHICQPGALIHLKTDSQFLFTYTRALLDENSIVPLACTDDLYADEDPETLDANLPPWLTQIQTYYEQQWRSRGIAIKYLAFPLPPEEELREPDVDIPLDTYRSYNRQKRSGLEVSR